VDYKVEYLQNEELRSFYLTQDLVRIGKLPSCEIELADNTVSRQHCKLVREGQGYRLVDLRSTNGSFVNGRRIEEKVLEEGDQITVGRTILTFRAVPQEESYRDSGEQQISMMMPLADLVARKERRPADTAELSLITELTAFGKELVASQDLEECFQRVGGLVEGLIHPERTYVFSYQERQNDLHLRYATGNRHHPGEEVTISKTIALKAIAEKVAILSSNTRQDSRFDCSQSVIMYGITSAMSVPIWTKDSIYGLIYTDTTSFAQVFAEKDLAILSLVANFVGLAIEASNNLDKLNRERRLRARLERYHSPGVVTRLLELPGDATGDLTGAREAPATVLFLDIVGFTTRAEKMPPVEVGAFLNHFFTEMTEIIFRHSGTLDKYIGDAIMAVFGAPLQFDDHPRAAVAAALDMMGRIEEMNRDASLAERVQIRIGIHTGNVISGDFGSPKRLDYTVLGNTVNIASRLETAVAKSGQIVVSDAVRQETDAHFTFEPIGERKLSGISQPVLTHRVTGKRG